MAPLPLLERLQSAYDGTARHLVEEFECVAGAVVIATCNRFEAYLDLEEPITASGDLALEMIVDALVDRTGVAREELAPHLQVHSGLRGVEHLFSVAAGLESVVVGETEIAGQVRDALERARAEGTTSSDLERAFQQAAQTSRGVRAATGLESVGRSLAEVALELAGSRLVSWADARVVLVGTGRYARVAVAALRRRGVVDIAVHSPSGRAAAFGTPRGLRVLDPADAPAAFGAADVIVTCSTADIVLDRATLAAARAGRTAGTGELLVVDLGLPRNVDPRVAELADVTLIDLETVRLHAGLDEFAAAGDARELVSHATAAFAEQTRELDAAPAIAALHRHVAALLDAEVERAAARGEGPEVAAALRHFAGVLLHEPTLRARALARAGETGRLDDALDALFELDVERPARADGARSGRSGA